MMRWSAGADLAADRLQEHGDGRHAGLDLTVVVQPADQVREEHAGLAVVGDAIECAGKFGEGPSEPGLAAVHVGHQRPEQVADLVVEVSHRPRSPLLSLGRGGRSANRSRRD